MPLTRRTFLVATRVAGLLGRTVLTPASRHYPFTLGVASGYPQPGDEQAFWTDGWDGYPRALEDVGDHGSALRTLASYAVEDGLPGPQPA